jgi:hypothetical protein
MGRHTLRGRSAPTAGHVMLGGVVERSPRRAHWVPLGATTVPYRYGAAYIAVCGARCLPAGPDYLAALQACPDCDLHERGFSHRTTPACCERPR